MAVQRPQPVSRKRILVRRGIALGSILLVTALTVWLVAASGSDTHAGPADGSAVTTDVILTDEPQLEPEATGCIARKKGTEVRNGKRRKRQAALTFDDGPGPSTQDVLDILDAHDAVATFFILGVQATDNRGMLRTIRRQGSELANHSNGHERDAGFESMAKTSKIIERSTGFTPCLYRPPYGVVSETGLANAKKLGMSTILWDVDSSDWANPGFESILAEADSVRNGSIVLMHDAGRDRDQTLATLPAFIQRLKNRGFNLVTVSELLRHKPVYPDP